MTGQYARSDDLKGLTQTLTTLVLLGLLWCLAGSGISFWLTVAVMPLIVLFTLRVFALMHECGHGSLFRSPWLNRVIGFVFGVIAGMPQYVWSRHHAFHHAHNGNWERYRGPYTTLSVDEYSAMTPRQQRRYRLKCAIGAAPVAGLIYLILNPRLTWIRGSIGLLGHIVASKCVQPGVPWREHAAGFKTRYWKTPREYWHMTANNVALLGVWLLLCWAFGAAQFFAIYLLTLSIAGGAGIILFTVQHNFEHSYASDSSHWNYTRGATQGTSFLVLPRWINWLTVNMAYHHVHHLSASIPNYCLAACHDDLAYLFTDVTRVKLSAIPAALKCILWDVRAQRIISVAEYQRSLPAGA